MSTALFDSCVVIDLLRGNSSAVQLVHAQAVRPRVCAVTLMELHAGFRGQREEPRAERVLATLDWADMNDRQIYARAGVFLRLFRPSHGLDVPDALIAATAEHHSLQLATLNVKHFPMFPKLKPAY